MSSPFTKKQLATYRERLEGLIAELEAMDSLTEDSRKPVELDQTTQGRLSRMDALQVQAMQEATADRRRSEKMRAKAALERMDAGDFGYCVSCGEDIPKKRLDHDPTVPTCVDCA
ncbi:MAG: molecular chaperone DnaK [Rhodospirillaceae bacterium]|nr:molecular chaperone DnaK [Rhodospirillaceae bacterium]HAD88464.1 molecular chaperone DnaK [Rhodospirillaceae bacterium]|tara:strand:- start:297 stop:641 length:345 start_codon:yes stop_codon:yes gene_type:complete